MHVTGVDNLVADALSCFQWDRFCRLALEVEQRGYQCPRHMWSISLPLLSSQFVIRYVRQFGPLTTECEVGGCSGKDNDVHVLLYFIGRNFERSVFVSAMSHKLAGLVFLFKLSGHREVTKAISGQARYAGLWEGLPCGRCSKPGFI